MATTERNNRMKEDISSLRKQFADDYKGRENFLDNFCRQATTSSTILPKDTAIKSRMTGTGSIHANESSGNPLSNVRQKNKLLAALKSIDDGKY